MKRGVSTVSSASQLVLLTGAGMLIWFDKNSMGMMRFLANKNRVWNQELWSSWMPMIAAIVAASLLIWTVIMVVASKSKSSTRSWMLLAALSIGTALFICITDTTLVRAYYFISFIFMCVVLLQVVKCILITTKQS